MAPNLGKTSPTSNDVISEMTTELKHSFLAIFMLVTFLVYAGYRKAGNGRFVSKCANPQHESWTTHLRDRNPKFVKYVQCGIRKVFRRMGARGQKFCTDCVTLAPKKRDFTAHMDHEPLISPTKGGGRKRTHESPSPSKNGPPRKIQARENIEENVNDGEQLLTPQPPCVFDTSSDRNSVQSLKQEIERLNQIVQKQSEIMQRQLETIQYLEEAIRRNEESFRRNGHAETITGQQEII